MKGPSDDDVSDQMKFVRKVYAILAVQLSITSAMIAAVQYNEEFRHWSIYSDGAIALQWTCFAFAIASMCAITCCFGRHVPINYILLLVFTVCESYMVAGLTAFYD